MDLPIDHFGLLGVTPGTDAQGVLRTLQLRLDRPPDQGFTAETLDARAELLRASAELLSDSDRRAAYEADLTALIRSAQPVQPALEIPGSREVAGLLLLLESGHALECWELASRCLHPPQAPALGSSREADLTLLAGLSALDGARDYRAQRRFEQAARLLQDGLQLLQRMGQMPALRESMHRELEELSPYRVLDLLSRDLSHSQERAEGMQLLEQLVQRRGGLEGDADPHFPSDQFQLFFKQIRGFLTVQEQVDLFSRWAKTGSPTADFLASIALTASGFVQRKPERIAAARDRLIASGRDGFEPLLANLHLLLGEVDEAMRLFDQGAAKDLRAWASRHSQDSLGRLCAYCRDWLGRDVLPGYRDLEADADLDAYFNDRDVVAWVEREDRRSGRHYSPAAAPQEPEPSQAFTTFFGDLDWSISAPWAGSDAGETVQLPGPSTAPAPADKNRWSLPPLRWPESLPGKARPWLLGAGTLLVLGTAGLWAMRHRSPAGLSPSAVKPLVVVPHTAAGNPPAAPAGAAKPPARPPAAAAPIPLRVASPDDTQLKALLEAWLSAKAAVLAGRTPAVMLSQVARPGPIRLLEDQRREDRQAGETQTIQARVEQLSVTQRSPQRIEVKAELAYSDSRLGKGGQRLAHTPQTTLRNGYVFGRDGDTWRLAATISGL